MLKSSLIKNVQALLQQSRLRQQVRRRKAIKSEQLETRALLSAGTLDTTFDSDGIVTTPMSPLYDEAYTVAVQADGKTVAAGVVYTPDGTEFGIARYNVDGSLDSSFDADGKASIQINQFSCVPTTVAIQPDGKIVVAGWTYNGSNLDFALARLMPDGTLDASFDTDGKVTTPIGSGDDNGYRLVIQPDGKIVLGGEYVNGGQRDLAIVRYEANGSLDTAFGTGGIFTRGLSGSTPDSLRGLALQPDGKIVASGYITTSNSYLPSLLRLNTNGTLDGTLNGDGFTFHSFNGIAMTPGSVTVLPDGDMLSGGVAFTNGRNHFAAIRYNDNGSLDTSFDGDGLLLSAIRPYADSAGQIFVRPDGKFYLGGNSYNGTDQDFALARYNSNGTLDTTFGTNGVTTTQIGSGDDVMSAMAVGPDGRIVLAGGTYSGGSSDFAVARYLGSNLPTSLLISSTQVVEGSPVATAVGTFSTVDPDAGETFTYSLVSGAGSTDNVSFVIDGNVLKTNAVFDSTVKSSYSIRVRTTENNGLWLEKTIALTVREGLRVYSTSITEDGTLQAGHNQIHLTFSVPMQNAAIAANYGLQRAGSDGLLTTSDSVEIPTSVIVSGQAVTLTFASMVEDTYRLIVRDEILDSNGLAMDGNADRFVGGDYTTDFVVDSGAPAIDLASEALAAAVAVGHQESGGAAVSADGRFVAFHSNSSNLVSGDSNGTADVFLKDLQTGIISLVSVGTDGQGNNQSYSPSISSDGRFIAFTSNASNLVPGDTNGTYDVFVKDLHAGTTTLVSTVANRQSNDASFNPSISSDGRFIAFRSNASNLTAGDTNGMDDIFVKDLETGTISIAPTGLIPYSYGSDYSYLSSTLSMSDDGRFVAYIKTIGSAVYDPTNGYFYYGGPYVYTFTYQYNLVDLWTNVNTVISAGGNGTGSSDSFAPSISSDGRFVAFASEVPSLVTGDTNGTYDVFVKDLQAGTITLVSTGAGGQGNNGSFQPKLSSDGRFIAFSSSASNLVTGDTNGTSDIFVKDLQTGVVTLISSGTNGQGSGSSFSPSISNNSRFVAFLSDASNLANGDNNRQTDVFVKDLAGTSLILASSADSREMNIAGNSSSSQSSLSSDGRYVAFYSSASNLVSSDSNGTNADIFVKNLQTGNVTLVSSGANGQGNGYSYSPSISSDGRYVAFYSTSSNLVASDTNGMIQDVFVKDLETGTVTLVSSGANGQGNGDSYSPSISSDGRYVAFNSSASNLVGDDTNGTYDVFVKDLQTGSVTLVSSGVNGQGNNYSHSPSITSDGRYVAFYSSASNLVSNDTNGTVGDVFVKDLETGVVTLVSSGVDGQGNGYSYSPSISSDGRYVAFHSDATNLFSHDSGRSDVFVKDLQTGVLTLVSSGDNGQGNGYSYSASISSDGRFVAFYSGATNLVSSDTNGTIADIFVKDLQTGVVTLVSSGAAGQGNRDSYAPVLSSDGGYLAFYSDASNLVGGDGNRTYDVFVVPTPLFGTPSFPLSLTSVNSDTFVVDRSGVGSGQLLPGTVGAFDGLNRLQIDGTEFSVPANSSASTQDGGQTVVSASSTFAGLSARREVTVRSTGSQSFARTLDVFTNSAGSTITVPVRLFGNLGSDAATTVFMTSDGDTIVERTDLWFGTDDGDGTGTPAIIHLLHAGSGLQPSSVNVIEDNVEWSYSLTVPAGETKRLAHFTVLGTTRAEAIAAVNALVTESGFAGEAAAFLDAGELGSIVNFQFNLAPTDILISSQSIDENLATLTDVGTLSFTDPNPGDTGTFSLPAGMGDNDLFVVSSILPSLRSINSLNFEAKSSYSLTIRVTDAGGLTFDKQFLITVNDLNETPINISLSGSTVSENLPSGTSVGTFSSSDPDALQSFVYSLVTIPGNTDHASFTIDGNTLKTTAAFDFETKSSYSLRVRTTDQGGLWFEKDFTITVNDVAEDVTAPVSLISALPATSNTQTLNISVTGSDPGAGASGVKEYDLYVSTGGAFTKFATVPAASPSTTFTGNANTNYWFRSLGRDNAGNVETKTTSDTYTRIGDVVPPSSQVLTASSTAAGLITLNMSGTKINGSVLTAFDVYVTVDGGGPMLVGAANAAPAGGSNYTGQILYQGLTDSVAHTYSFYSRARDGAGNVESAPATGDVTQTWMFASAPLTATGIDVQNGVSQRSYVRYLDVLFSTDSGVNNLLSAGRVKVERFGIDATSVVPGTGTVIAGAGLTQSGNRMRLDFGATGLGGLRQAGNGFYRILLDMDGNGSFADTGDSAFEFHRLFGDATGDGKVDAADTARVNSQFGRTGANLDGDVDGNGAVNSTDRLYVTQQLGKKLLDPLLAWLDD